MDTILSKDLQAAENMEQYDAACKKFLSEKCILAWIMKSCLEEYRDCTIEEIAEKYIEGTPQVGEVPVPPDQTNPVIKGMNTEDTTLNEGTVIYDIRFYAIVPGTDEKIRLIINVEAQYSFYPGYPIVKRGIYYCSRMISAQHGTEFTNSHYENIKKVSSIWICSDPPAERMNTITRYVIREENLVGNVQEPYENYDMMSVIMICLGDPEGSEEKSVLRLLDVLLSRETGHEEKRRVLRDEFEIPMSEALESEVSQMCNLSQGVWEDGHRNGREQGLKEGIEKGIEKGVEKSLLDSVRSLMDTLGLSADQAMAALKISEADRTKYQKLLQERS